MFSTLLYINLEGSECTCYLDTQSSICTGILLFCGLKLIFHLFLFQTEFKSWLPIREGELNDWVRQGQAP